MAFNLVPPFAADDRTAYSVARCRTIADAWLGAGSTAAVTTWGGYHSLINPVLSAMGLAPIANNNTGQVWMDRMNALNNAEGVIQSFGALGWWNADRTDLITLSGNQVTNWRDSLSAIDVAQASSSMRPLYSATSFNGKPSITFDGSDDVLLGTTSLFPVGSNTSNMYGTASQEAVGSTGGAKMIMTYGFTAAGQRRYFGRNSITNNNRTIVAAGNGTVDQVVNGLVDYTGRRVLRGQVTSTGLVAYLDGTLDTMSALAISGTVAGGVAIGATTTPTAFWQGSIRDVIVTGAITDDQNTYLTNFLTGRRAL